MEGQRRGHRRPCSRWVPDTGDGAAALGSTVRWVDGQEGRDGAWQVGTAVDRHPKGGKKTAGGGEEGSWGPVMTLELGSLREKAAVLGLSQKDSPGRGTAKAEALSPSAFMRIWGEVCLAWGWWSPPMKPPLTPHSRDSGTLPKVIFAHSPIPLLMGTVAEKPQGSPELWDPTCGLGGLQLGEGW